MKYKVGDKVKLRDGLKVNSFYGNHVFIEPMRDDLNKTLTITAAIDRTYRMGESIYNYTDEMLEPAKPYKVGDILVDEDGRECKVLEVFENTFVASKWNDFDAVYSGLYTFKEVEDEGWKLKDKEEKETETIEIGGVKYDKKDVEDRLKDLEPIN